MTEPLQLGATIGIIGGGQLGRMLSMAAARLGFQTVVLEPDPNCPAAQTCNSHIIADYTDEAALKKLAEASDLVTYEFENVPVKPARFLEALCPVRPSPRALEVAQDRLTEKAFLRNAGINVAEYFQVDTNEDLARGLVKFGGSGVLKTRRLGYDGKGQKVFRDAKPEEASRGFDELGGVPLVLEAFVPFRCEISVIAARGLGGAISCFDPALNVHRDGILRTSTIPANVSEETVKIAKKMAHNLLTALEYVGVLGLELFVLDDGQVLANEFAPRVHNSGHWTEAACTISQFEQHIRAVAGLELGSPERHSDCVMENLIGDDVDNVPELLANDQALVHLYGKEETRPGRKMGHVTTRVRSK